MNLMRLLITLSLLGTGINVHAQRVVIEGQATSFQNDSIVIYDDSGKGFEFSVQHFSTSTRPATIYTDSHDNKTTFNTLKGVGRVARARITVENGVISYFKVIHLQPR